MLVKCVRTKRTELLESQELQEYDRNVHLDQIDLTSGAVYPVFGVVYRNGRAWYLVCADKTDSYPKPYMATFFEVTDRSSPLEWVRCPAPRLGEAALLPKIWAGDEGYIERLVEGDREALEVFERIKTIVYGQLDATEPPSVDDKSS
jgi:hypothetical protein